MPDGISLAHANCERVFGRWEVPMSVARVVEISSTSKKSFEDAIVQGIARANKTLREIRSAWVKEQEVQVDGGKITGYKVNLMVTFVLEDTMGS
jgi:flavin-binding protein dodecin